KELVADARDDRADRRRPDDELVPVEVYVVGVIAVVVKAQLRGVAGPDRILAVVVRDRYVFLARIEDIAHEDTVQAAVGVLLERTEVGEVVLVAVRAVVAEEADAEVVVGENEAAEVAAEALDPRAGGNEVVPRGEIGDVVLDERLLQRDVIVFACRPPGGIDIDRVSLADVDVVDVEDRRQAELPVTRLEGGV